MPTQKSGRRANVDGIYNIAPLTRTIQPQPLAISQHGHHIIIIIIVVECCRRCRRNIISPCLPSTLPPPPPSLRSVAAQVVIFNLQFANRTHQPLASVGPLSTSLIVTKSETGAPFDFFVCRSSSQNGSCTSHTQHSAIRHVFWVYRYIDVCVR